MTTEERKEISREINDLQRERKVATQWSDRDDIDARIKALRKRLYDTPEEGPSQRQPIFPE